MEQSASKTILPRERAFVVQLHADAAADDLRGRVEHVQSGEARHFETLEALLAFMAQRL